MGSVTVFAKLASYKRPNARRGIPGIPILVEIGSPGKNAWRAGEPIDMREITHFHRLTGQVSRMKADGGFRW